MKKRVKEGSTTEESSVSNNASPSKEVTIGDQVWMAENLNADKFRNGDSITHAITKEAWKQAGENEHPAWCYYDNDPSNGKKYGKLYNWYAVNDPRGLAPKGWHVPSDQEWTTLTDHLGGEDVAGTKMKSSRGWYNDGNGTNESGFSALPGGYRYHFGRFFSIGRDAYWWSSTEYSTYCAWTRLLDYDRILDIDPDFVKDAVLRDYDGKGKGALSVRCLRD